MEYYYQCVVLLFVIAKLVAVCSGGRGLWTANGTYEYYPSPKGVSKSYESAQAYCLSQDAQLALVKDDHMQDFLTTLIGAESGVPYAFYIGLRDTGGNGTYTWNDHTALNYTNWNAHQPNNIGKEECTVMGNPAVYEDGLPWSNAQCTHGEDDIPVGFICQRWIARRGRWATYGDHEYHVSPSGVSSSYEYAEAKCLSLGGQVALVKTKQVDKFLQTLIESDSGAPYAFYIGLQDPDGDATYRWNDGSDLTYTDWIKGQPNNVHHEKCTAMGNPYIYKPEMGWSNCNCTREEDDAPVGWICQRKIALDQIASDDFVLDFGSFAIGFCIVLVFLVAALFRLRHVSARYTRLKKESLVEASYQPEYGGAAVQSGALGPNEVRKTDPILSHEYDTGGNSENSKFRQMEERD